MPSLEPDQGHSPAAAIPPELITRIVHVSLDDEILVDTSSGLRDDAKRRLSSLSLVCKHWSALIRPLLFSHLELRGREDLRSLRSLVESPQPSSLHGGIRHVNILQDAADPAPWIVYLHRLSARLEQTKFECTVFDGRPPDTAQVTDLRHAPFRALPRLPPSYIRLERLTLHGLRFANMAEPMRLIRSIPSLGSVHYRQLTFADSSSITQPPRVRRSHATLVRCLASGFADVPLCSLTTLVCCSVGSPTGAPALLPLDVWTALVKALAALLPGMFDSVSVEPVQASWREHGLLAVSLVYRAPPITQNPRGLRADVTVHILPPSTDPAGDLCPHPVVTSLYLTFNCSEATFVDALSWDALRTTLDQPSFQTLVIESWTHGDGILFDTYRSSRAILAATLHGRGLARAVESGKAVFLNTDRSEGQLTLTSADIAAAPKELSVRGVVVSLDAEQQAGWLMCLEARREAYRDALLDAWVRFGDVKAAEGREEGTMDDGACLEQFE